MTENTKQEMSKEDQELQELTERLQMLGYVIEQTALGAVTLGLAWYFIINPILKYDAGFDFSALAGHTPEYDYCNAV